MKTITLLTGAALLAVSGATLAQHHGMAGQGPAGDMTREQARQKAGEHFARLDQNNDGRVTREEAAAMHQQNREQMMERRFQKMDADGNGSVTLQEMRAAHAGMRGHAGQKHGQEGRAMRRMHGSMDGHMFGDQDFVTREQMLEKALEHFDRIDADDNGVVTMAERQQMREAHHERRKQRR